MSCKLKFTTPFIITIIMALLFSGCVDRSIKKDTTYVTSSEAITGKKSIKLKSKYLSVKNCSESELLVFISEKTGKSYKLVSYNLPEKFFHVTYKSSEKINDAIYDSIFNAAFKNDYYKISDKGYSFVQKITDNELLNYTTSLYEPGIIEKMFSGKPKPADGYKPRMMSMNDRYSIWNYTIDEYCEYVTARIGVTLINETSKPKNEKCYFEYNSNFAPTFELGNKTTYVHAMGK